MTKFKYLIIIISSIFALTSFILQDKYIEPTGTYKLVSKVIMSKGDAYGYSGTLQVKKISINKIIVNLDVNKGAPSYNSGGFYDTLNYNDNIAIFTTPEYDSTCKITLTFSKKGIDVKHETADYNDGCGFGHSVGAKGFYKKISSKVPILIEQ